jgi:hypothetical protein
MQILNQIYEKVSREEGVRFFDLAKITTTLQGGYSPNFFDGQDRGRRVRVQESSVRMGDGTVKTQTDEIHFNGFGNQLLSAKIAAEIKSIPGFQCANQSSSATSSKAKVALGQGKKKKNGRTPSASSKDAPMPPAATGSTK